MLSSLEVPPKKPTVGEQTRSILVMILLLVIVVAAVYFAVTFGDPTAPACGSAV